MDLEDIEHPWNYGIWGRPSSPDYSPPGSDVGDQYETDGK